MFLTALLGVFTQAAPVPLAHQFPAESSTGTYRWVHALSEEISAQLARGVVTVATPPDGSNRLFIGELGGTIRIAQGPGRTRLTTFLDLTDRIAVFGEHGLCSFAFHPGYATNGQFFVFYSHRAADSAEIHNRLSRFRVDPDNPDAALDGSEEPMISQIDRHEWHNSGDLHFGPDGYLYVSLGDEGGSFSYSNAGLWHANFFSGILRIDPDHRADNLLPTPHPAVFPGAYRIPRDNPFLNRTNYIIGTDNFNVDIRPEEIRGEFWAVGFRNPWRMSFDPGSGTLYANDVGMSAREEVNIILPGGHYGWVMKEGTSQWPYFVPATGLTDPVHEYEHNLGRRAITGSLFYRGTRHPDLAGSYLFTDMAGHCYAMQRLEDGSHATPIEFARGPEIITLGLDPEDGSILMGGWGLYRLVREETPTDPLPETLSDSGLFSDVSSLVPAAGLIPYEVNQSFWSDHAHKQRWFGVSHPDDRIGFTEQGSWDSPIGTVWVKHFELPVNQSGPDPVFRRLETRVLVRSADGIYGATYRWNEGGTDAELVPANGFEEDIIIQDPDGSHIQRWRYPARGECVACHTAAAGHSLSFNTAQLNRTDPDGTHQLHRMLDAGYFKDSPVIRPNLLPAHPQLDDESVSIEHRVRSYLDVNCSACHLPGSPVRADWDARSRIPLADAAIVGTIGRHQLATRFEIFATRIVEPGKPLESILYRRVAEFGPLHMPPIATSESNTVAVSLLQRWINDFLPTRTSYEAWAGEHLDRFPTGLRERDADPDGDGDSNLHEFLVGTDPGSGDSRWQPVIIIDGYSTPILRFTRKAHRDFRAEMAPTPSGPWTDVDHPFNRHRWSAEDEEVGIPLPDIGTAFFRVRLIEP
jgi:glucose/arabinose dehydrogenase